MKNNIWVEIISVAVHSRWHSASDRYFNSLTFRVLWNDILKFYFMYINVKQHNVLHRVRFDLRQCRQWEKILTPLFIYICSLAYLFTAVIFLFVCNFIHQYFSSFPTSFLFLLLLFSFFFVISFINNIFLYILIFFLYLLLCLQLL